MALTESKPCEVEEWNLPSHEAPIYVQGENTGHGLYVSSFTSGGRTILTVVKPLDGRNCETCSLNCPLAVLRSY